MSYKRQNLGRSGEKAALKYLINMGYKILERNFRCRLGEIDIIAREGGELVFVEVRACKKSSSFGPAEQSIGRKKEQKLRAVAGFYLARKGLDTACRFDVVAVDADESGKPCDIRLHRGVF